MWYNYLFKLEELISVMWEEITRETMGWNYPVFFTKFFDKSSKKKICKFSNSLIGNFYNVEKDRKISFVRSTGLIGCFDRGFLQDSKKFTEESGIVFLSSIDNNSEVGLLKYRILALYSDNLKQRSFFMGYHLPKNSSIERSDKTQINEGSFLFPSWKTIDD